MIKLRYGNTNTFFIDGLLVDESRAFVITCGESRAFLKEIGISGEIIETPSHSPDSISLMLDDGDCFVGDLEPVEYVDAYEDNAQLKEDWTRIMLIHPKRVFYAHRPEKNITNAFKEESSHDEQVQADSAENNL